MLIHRTLFRAFAIALAAMSSTSIVPTPAKAQFEYMGYNGVMARVMHRNNMRYAYRNRSSGSTSATAAPTILESFDYAPGSTEAVNAKAAFLDQVRRNYADPASAELVTGLLNDGTLDAEYAKIISSYGLDDNNTVDALTALAVHSWIIANRKSPPDTVAIEGARKDMRLVAGPELTKMTDVERRAAGETARYALISMHIAWVAAIQGDNPSSDIEVMSEQVNESWMKVFEWDLRELTINEDGFEPV